MIFKSLKYRRFCALFLDLLLISLLTMFLTNNTISNPYYNDYSETYEEFTKLIENNSYTYNTQEELNNYINQISPIVYKLNQTKLFGEIWFVVLSFLYFGLFQYSTGGQTLGKKIYKLKLTDKNNKKLGFINSMIRPIFIGELYLFDGIVFISILNILGILLIKDQNIYMLYYSLIALIGIIYEVFMIIFFIKNKKNEALHDKILKTKVIEVK